jgi:hypothetical protein
MSKPSELQREVILAVKNELDYWLASNDIHSPSHGTSIEHDMFANLPDVDEHVQECLDEIETSVRVMWADVARITPCPIRKKQMKDFKP